MVHERYRRQTDERRQTDGRTTTYSEHEHEFTFAKNRSVLSSSSPLYEIPLLTFLRRSLLILIFFNQNPIFFSQKHSANYKTAVVCYCYEYDPVVVVETAQVALDSYHTF